MELSDLLALLSRWAHILGAMILVGGTLFSRFALLPGAADSAASEEVRDAIRKKWMKFVAGAALFLLVSGLYNTAVKSMGYQMPPIYHGLLGVKILLALFAFWLSATLVGRSERAKKFRLQEKKWLSILTLVVLAITLMAGFMKVDSADYPIKVRGESDQIESPEAP